jgi:hypothetical protein
VGGAGGALGYAGGLGPQSLAEALPRIEAAAGQGPFWMDMESALREEQDRFDIHRRRTALMKALRLLLGQTEPSS